MSFGIQGNQTYVILEFGYVGDYKSSREVRKKLGNKRLEFIFLGYSHNSKEYRAQIYGD